MEIKLFFRFEIIFPLEPHAHSPDYNHQTTNKTLAKNNRLPKVMFYVGKILHQIRILLIVLFFWEERICRFPPPAKRRRPQLCNDSLLSARTSYKIRLRWIDSQKLCDIHPNAKWIHPNRIDLNVFYIDLRYSWKLQPVVSLYVIDYSCSFTFIHTHIFHQGPVSTYAYALPASFPPNQQSLNWSHIPDLK